MANVAQLTTSPFLQNDAWKDVRSIAAPLATFADDDWIGDQDYDGAKASGLALINASYGERGDLAQLGLMITVLNAAGAIATDILADVSVVTVSIVELVAVRQNRYRLLTVDVLTDFATNIQGIGRSSTKIQRGQYALQLTGVAGMNVAAETIVVSAKLI